MTTNRAREVAKKILDRTRDTGPRQAASEAESVILAYRDEVRREVLKEVSTRDVGVPNSSGCPTAETTHWCGVGAYAQRGLFRVMLDEMIAETGPAETTAPISTRGREVVVGCDSPNVAADRDFVLRTLAQAYVGNDYTIEGRKFRDAVGRLWPR